MSLTSIGLLGLVLHLFWMNFVIYFSNIIYLNLWINQPTFVAIQLTKFLLIVKVLFLFILTIHLVFRLIIIQLPFHILTVLIIPLKIQ